MISSGNQIKNNRPITALIYPRGHCKQSPFYFRGDEIHKEPEFLENEYKAAKLEYNRHKSELMKEKEIFNKVQLELAKKDGYTVALSYALGDESHNTEDNARLRLRLNDLSEKIEKIEHAIEDMKSQQHPGLIYQLQREKAFYHAEIEDLRIGIFTGIDSIRNYKEEIANIVCSSQMLDLTIVKSDRLSLQKFYSILRSDMDKLFASFSGKQALGAKQRVKSLKLPDIMQRLVDKKDHAFLEYEEAKREKLFAQIRARITTQQMLDHIEVMNQTIVALGGEPYDIEELYSKYTKTRCNENDQLGREDEKGDKNYDNNKNARALSSISPRSKDSKNKRALRPRSAAVKR